MLILLSLNLYSLTKKAVKRLAASVKNWLNTPPKTWQERYLDQAHDIYDLENRMRKLDGSHTFYN